MTNPTSSQKETAADGVSPGLRTWGTRSWLYLGIALWVLAIITFFTTISGLFVPLVIAVVLAMLCYPLVDTLAAHRVNRTIGSLLVILLVIVVLAGTAWITVAGIYSQSDEMATQLEAGLLTFSTWSRLNLSATLIQQIRTQALAALPQVASGMTSFFFSGFSGIIAFFMGAFTALFLLFYLLSDWQGVLNWVGRHVGVPAELGLTLVADATSAIRVYYYALTLANLPVAIAVGLTMWLLGLPLALPVALVTMITSYIPYLGAILSATFAALVALGAGGVTDAAIIVGVILGLQNIMDPIIANRITSDKLQMNPIVTLLTTLGGGILFGALGATLASPITAVLLEARSEAQLYHAKQQAAEPAPIPITGQKLPSL
jgi:predicted PurR-regulated permease PerM